jgi:predicted LPLAT superfamily acyltransferase
MSGKHWSEFREVGFLAGMRLVFWLYRHGGALLFTVALQPVVFYYFASNGVARTASREFLQRAGTAGADVSGSWLEVYRHFLAFARSTIDKLGVWADSSRFEPVTFRNRQILLDQLATGRGGILLGAHLGNMEICRSFSRATKGLKLNILVHTQHADMFNQLLQELHLHAELELIEVSKLSPVTAIRLADCIERGEFIAILADRIPVASRGRCRELEFLGAKALFPEGPFILASLLKCAVFTLFCTRGEDGYEIRCDKFADRVYLPRPSRGSALQKYMQRFVKILEENVRLTPLQWFNFYPFWSQRK